MLETRPTQRMATASAALDFERASAVHRRIEKTGEALRGLPELARRQLERLLDCVATDSVAPTSVTDPAGIMRDHLADSLVALELPQVRAARTIADLGSGAGFPGLPLAIAVPRSRVWLVESNGRKCAFIAHAAEASGVTNTQVVNARAEAWPEGMESCDLVVAAEEAAVVPFRNLG